jgi:hypothetical protein
MTLKENSSYAVTSNTTIDDVRQFVENGPFVVVAHWNNCFYCNEFLKENGVLQNLLQKTTAKFIDVEYNDIQKLKNKDIYKYLKLDGISYYPYIYALNSLNENYRHVYKESSRDLTELTTWVNSLTQTTGGFQKKESSKKKKRNGRKKRPFSRKIHKIK